jgi:hypothetical protein
MFPSVDVDGVLWYQITSESKISLWKDFRKDKIKFKFNDHNF